MVIVHRHRLICQCQVSMIDRAPAQRHPRRVLDLKIIFAGSGEFGLPSLCAILESGCQVVQVVSQPDREAGRGKKLTPTPIARLANERGLSLLRTANINAESLPAADVL